LIVLFRETGRLKTCVYFFPRRLSVDISVIFWCFIKVEAFSVMFTPVGFFNNPSTQHRTHRRYRPKPLSQRNLVSAFFGLTTVIFIATALVEPRWFYVKGGACKARYIGIYKMLSLKSTDPSSKYIVRKNSISSYWKLNFVTYLISYNNNPSVNKQMWSLYLNVYNLHHIVLTILDCLLIIFLLTTKKLTFV
jgi:hypothetical protein